MPSISCCLVLQAVKPMMRQHKPKNHVGVFIFVVFLISIKIHQRSFRKTILFKLRFKTDLKSASHCVYLTLETIFMKYTFERLINRFISLVERGGNALPHPAVLFGLFGQIGRASCRERV